jgi:hypothetical protein
MVSKSYDQKVNAMSDSSHNYNENEISSADLTAIATLYGTDKSAHTFTYFYDRLFSSRRTSIRYVMEIGIGTGASLKMWRDYFPFAKIMGIDVNPNTMFTDERISTVTANQANREELKTIATEFGQYIDIIVDDGSHDMMCQAVSMGVLFPLIKLGGYYIVEDLHTSFSNAYGARADLSNTTGRAINELIATGVTANEYLLQEEKEYLCNQIQSITLYSRIQRPHRDGFATSITAVLHKAE